MTWERVEDQLCSTQLPIQINLKKKGKKIMAANLKKVNVYIQPISISVHLSTFAI